MVGSPAAARGAQVRNRAAVELQIRCHDDRAITNEIQIAN